MTAHSLRIIFAAGLMVLTAIAAAAVKPSSSSDAPAAPDLDAMMPETFGAWRRIAVSQAVLPAESELGPGEAVVYRAYKDEAGRVVTLVVAYGPPLGDSVRLHRPETCYAAQGFRILARMERRSSLRGAVVPVIDLETEGPSRSEAVSYWLRSGRSFSVKSSDAAWRRLQHADGPSDSALVRVSSVGAAPANFTLHEEFMEEFSTALSPQAAALLLGDNGPT